MASIKVIVEFIRTAMYGKDVRENIASGIESINNNQVALNKKFDDEIKNMTLDDPSSAEIVAARTDDITGESFNTIGERINKVNMKSNIIVCNEVPVLREKNAFYFRVTDKQSGESGTGEIKVSPNMGIKIV
ncbi:MAG: hypothetical protein RR620_11990 [Clostridium sp.]